ncbi:MAG: hypothetical protein FGM55_13240 [Rhodoferax sp.]|nr:hypothetical protein [Rhodoferax sp.]
MPPVWSDFAAALAQSPWLPGSTSQLVARHVLWALVLGAGVQWFTARIRLGPALRRAGVLLVLLWALLPGAWSPTFWLGMAFQAPSLLSAGLGLGLLWRGRLGLQSGAAQPVPTAAAVLGRRLALAGVLLGWLLLLDMLALLPDGLPVYRWGFGTPALLLVLLPCAGLARRAPGGAEGLAATPLSWVVLALVAYTVLRWPTGNLWDALLDPLLWLALHVGLLRTALRRWRGRGAYPV